MPLLGRKNKYLLNLGSPSWFQRAVNNGLFDFYLGQQLKFKPCSEPDTLTWSIIGSGRKRTDSASLGVLVMVSPKPREAALWSLRCLDSNLQGAVGLGKVKNCRSLFGLLCCYANLSTGTEAKHPLGWAAGWGLLLAATVLPWNTPARPSCSNIEIWLISPYTRLGCCGLPSLGKGV